MNTTFAVLFWFLKSVDAIWRDLQDSVNVRENLLPERFFVKLSQPFAIVILHWLPSFWKSWRWVCIIASDKINDSPFRWRFWIRPDPFFCCKCDVFYEERINCTTVLVRTCIQREQKIYFFASDRLSKNSARRKLWYGFSSLWLTFWPH